MQLYHFTAPIASHLGSILRLCAIATTTSKVDGKFNRFLNDGKGGWSWDSVGPQVVWLTDDSGHKWAEPTLKTRARLTVEPDIAVPWAQWSAEQGIDRKWYSELNESGLNQADHWYVVPRVIRAAEITELRFALPGEDSLKHVFRGPELTALFASRERQRALGLPND